MLLLSTVLTRQRLPDRVWPSANSCSSRGRCSARDWPG